MPDNTCPVIIPGRETIPTANNELTKGIMAAFMAIFRAWIGVESRSSSAWNRSAAILTEFIAFEKIMPASGIRYRGSNQGSTWITNWVEITRTGRLPIEIAPIAIK